MISISKLKISNANIVTSNKTINNGCILINDKKIIEVSPINIDTQDYEIIDAGGLYVSAGFIDIHTHGAGGYDFMDGKCEAYLGAAKMHAKYGTTSIVPTTLASSNDELKETFKIYETAKNQNKYGAQFVGLHLEGPYFSKEYKGAQDERYIRNPTKNEYEEILGWTEDIVRWSAAPELEGALEFGKYLMNTGVLPCIAHTAATYEQVEKAYECGFSHMTHFYSCMSSVTRVNGYRHAGAVESGYLIDDMTVEIIADGIHLPKSLLKLVYKIKGADRTALVTDSMRGAGMPEGESILGSLKNGQKVMVEDGVAKLMDRSAFAGSVATADRLVKNMIKLADVPLVDAVKMMTCTPAKIIGIDNKKGFIRNGYDADLVFFDDDIRIDKIMIGGVLVEE